jgi:hypothetical protein
LDKQNAHRPEVVLHMSPLALPVQSVLVVQAAHRWFKHMGAVVGQSSSLPHVPRASGVGKSG